MELTLKIDLIITGIATTYFLYNFLIYKKFGPLPSVSASYYELILRKRGGWFQLFLALLSTGIIMLSGLTDHQHSWAFFLSGAGGCGVLVAALYNRDKITELVHIAGASTLIVSALLGIGLIYGLWLGTYIMAGLFLVGLVKRILFKAGLAKQEGLFRNDGLWYEHIATAVIIIFLYIGNY